VERLLTLRQVAEILSVSFITTKRWIYSGRRKAVKLPTGKWRKIMRIPNLATEIGIGMSSLFGICVLRDYENSAPSPGGVFVGGCPVPLGSSATSEATWIEKSRWLSGTPYRRYTMKR